MSVDTSKFTYTITKNGQQVGGEYTANVTASSNNDNNNHKYNLTATLPKLNAGESCQIKYKYYYDTSLCDSGNESQASNKVTGESINKSLMKRLLIHQAVLLNTREMILIKQVHTTQTVRLSSGQSLLIKKEMILLGLY